MLCNGMMKSLDFGCMIVRSDNMCRSSKYTRFGRIVVSIFMLIAFALSPGSAAHSAGMHGDMKSQAGVSTTCHDRAMGRSADHGHQVMVDHQDHASDDMTPAEMDHAAGKCCSAYCACAFMVEAYTNVRFFSYNRDHFEFNTAILLSGQLETPQRPPNS